MSQFNQEPYVAGIMNEQQLDQISSALYSYCKVMRVPKLGAVPIVVTVLEGLIITLVIAAPIIVYESRFDTTSVQFR